jgi:AraC family transcriptional regulator
MNVRIETIPEKKLVGKRMRMTLSSDRTFELWRSFMLQREGIRNRVTTELISMQVYDPLKDFAEFGPHTEFEKWAVAEVSDFDDIPAGMERYCLGGGSYAVFIHRGSSETFPQTLRYIYGTWLPQSGYELDDREHFEVLGDKFRLNDVNSEEEVWIPVRSR